MRPTQRLRMPLSRIPQSSYYDAHNRPGAALQRARSPYLVKNTITGLCIIGFIAGVCAFLALRQVTLQRKWFDKSVDTFTIKAIGQDDFSDIPMPDVPAQPAHAPNASAVTSAGKR